MYKVTCICIHVIVCFYLCVLNSTQTSERTLLLIILRILFSLYFLYEYKGRDYIHVNKQHNILCLFSKMRETGSQITITPNRGLFIVTVAKGD